MPLFSLPPEILCDIFDRVGSDFFYEDLGRLAVSKQWLEYARPACFKNVVLPQRQLRQFMFREGTRTYALQDMWESLDIRILGCTMVGWEYLEEYPLDASKTLTPQNRYDTWLETTLHDLDRITAMVHNSRKLHKLRLSTSRERAHRACYYPLHRLNDLLRPHMDSLRVLELHLPSSYTDAEMAKTHHPCLAISAHLHTLTRLSVCMRHVCPRLLEPQHPGGRADDDHKLPLREVIVNMALHDGVGLVDAVRSGRCGAPTVKFSKDLRAGRKLRDDMVEAAHRLKDRMLAPRVFWIITFSNSEDILSDILTSQTCLYDDYLDRSGDEQTIEPIDDESVYWEEDPANDIG